MNLTGEWLYNEEFDDGISTGVVNIVHEKDDTISGYITLLESVTDETPLHVKETVSGLVLQRKVILQAKDYEILSGAKETEYFLDSWEGIINSEGDIVGNSIDLNGSCGVFIMKKLDDK